MSALGTLRANFPSIALSTRMPTVQEDGQGSGNGASGFLSLIGEPGNAATSAGTGSIRADIGPTFAYQAALIGNMLNDSGNGDTGSGETGGGQTVDGNPDNTLVALETEPATGVAASSDEDTTAIKDDVTNDLPLKGPGDFYSPIGRPVFNEPTNDLV